MNSYKPFLIIRLICRHFVEFTLLAVEPPDRVQKNRPSPKGGRPVFEALSLLGCYSLPVQQ